MRRVLLACLALLLVNCYGHIQNKSYNFNDANLSAKVYRHTAGEFYQIDLLFKNKTSSLMRMQVECRWFASENDRPLSKAEITVFTIEPKAEVRHTRKALAGTYGYYWDCQFGYKICP